MAAIRSNVSREGISGVFGSGSVCYATLKCPLDYSANALMEFIVTRWEGLRRTEFKIGRRTAR